MTKKSIFIDYDSFCKNFFCIVDDANYFGTGLEELEILGMHNGFYILSGWFMEMQLESAHNSSSSSISAHTERMLQMDFRYRWFY